VFEPVGRTATKLLPALSKNLPLATFLNESPLPPLPTKDKLKDLFFLLLNKQRMKKGRSRTPCSNLSVGPQQSCSRLCLKTCHWQLFLTSRPFHPCQRKAS